MSELSIQGKKFLQPQHVSLFKTVLYLMKVLTSVVISGRVDENSTLKSLVEKHFESRTDNVAMITELRHFCRREITDLKLYFQKEPSEVSMNSLTFSSFPDVGYGLWIILISVV